MLPAAVRHLFGRPPPPIFQAAPAAAPLAVPEPRIRLDWPPSRIALTNRLWGPGFIFPGGEMETLRLTRPMGAATSASLLVVGIGAGGPASAITRNFGAWVTGLDNDPGLLASARTFINKAQLTKKIRIEAWNPHAPAFVPKSHHHCLALEPLHGAQPEPILDGLARALRPGGQLMMTELTADAPMNPNDPTVARWAALERRDLAGLVSGVSVTRMLGRVGLDVRVAEDISARHLEQAVLGWRVLLRDLNGAKPPRQEAAQMVAEAELWLLRRRLMRDGRLRLMRWHAISRAVA
jgi:SAM-dependent methyltransferase